MTAEPKYWFTNKCTASNVSKYRHCLLVEIPDNWDGHRNGVIDYFRGAHADSRRHLTALAGASLHPAGAPQPPYDAYPHQLPDITLQGYFGEILCAHLAEQIGAAGFSDWVVPAHLFRFHLQAFQFLEQRSQNGTAPSTIVGRTGDDCLAFRRDSEGEITAVLFCEAKCTTSHDAGLIKDAHKKLSASAIVDVLRIVEILRDSTEPGTEDWITSLQEFHLRLHATPATFQRADLVCYVHASIPSRKATWITAGSPHTAYTGGRALDVYECRLADVMARIREIYSDEVWR